MLTPTYSDLFAQINQISNLQYGALFILALSSLTVYSIILAG